MTTHRKKHSMTDPLDPDMAHLSHEETGPLEEAALERDEDQGDEDALQTFENPFEPHMPEDEEEASLEAQVALGSLPTTGMALAPKPFEVVDLRLDEIQPNPRNANEQSPEIFNQLVATLQEDGPDQPLVVVPLSPPQGSIKYQLVKGEHRWRAARVLGWPTFPAVIREDWDELAQITRMVKDNVIKGELNKKKFTELVSMLRRDYHLDTDLQAALLGFDTSKEMAKYLERTKPIQALDDKAHLDAAKSQLKVLDDLSLVLNSLFTKHGHTLPYGYMAFLWGGQISYMIEMDHGLKAQMEEVAKVSEARKIDLNILLAAIMEEALPKMRPLWEPAPTKGEGEHD